MHLGQGSPPSEDMLVHRIHEGAVKVEHTRGSGGLNTAIHLAGPLSSIRQAANEFRQAKDCL